MTRTSATPEVEAEIADKLFSAMDAMTRIIRTPVSREYVEEKLLVATINALAAVQAMGFPDLDVSTRGDVDWDVSRVYQQIADKSKAVQALNEAWQYWHGPGSDERRDAASDASLREVRQMVGRRGEGA